ncbi:MAG: glycoside hydrolase family 3 protein [Acidobacteria bacterium]|nr:glycoside hydrolase family 3 protein [Acidobacteriota bacterium]
MPLIDDDLDAATLAGQGLIVGFSGAVLDQSTLAMLSKLRPAGIILFARNLQQRLQVRNLMQNLVETCAPRLVCIDQEGGPVDRLRAVFPPFPSPASLARFHTAKIFYDYGRFSGEILHAFGFNVTLAPVLDLHFHDEDNALRSRYLGHDPFLVTAFAKEYLAGLQSAGVLGCGKHFPGLGRARLDTHLQLAEIEAPLEQLAGADLVPYQQLRDRLKMVMVNHACYPQLEKKPFSRRQEGTHEERVPASCAPTVYQLLRTALGFSGIALTDDLDMGAIRRMIPPEEIPTRCFKAGADLLLVGTELDFARMCRDELVTLLQQPFWRQQAGQRAEKLNSLPAVPSVDLEQIQVLENAFQDWKKDLGLG